MGKSKGQKQEPLPPISPNDEELSTSAEKPDRPPSVAAERRPSVPVDRPLSAASKEVLPAIKSVSKKKKSKVPAAPPLPPAPVPAIPAQKPSRHSLPAKLIPKDTSLQKPTQLSKFSRKVKSEVYADDEGAYDSEDELDEEDYDSDISFNTDPSLELGPGSELQREQETEKIPSKGAEASDGQSKVSILAWGYEDSYRKGFIKIGKQTIRKLQDGTDDPRGLHLVTLYPSSKSEIHSEVRQFDTWKAGQESDALVSYLEQIPPGAYVIGASADEINKHLSKPARYALEDLGIDVSKLGYRVALAFIAVKGKPDKIQQQITARHEGPAKLTGSIDIGNVTDLKPKVPSENSIKITPNMLLAGKAALTSHNKKQRGISGLGRDLLFDQYKQTDQFPVEKIKDMFTSNNDLVNLDLTGVDQLTDFFFRTVKLVHQSSLFVRKIQHIILKGCVNLTDQGIAWMSELFTSLESVTLSGCGLLTERSIQVLLSNCPKILNITMKGCDVGLVPASSEDRIVSIKLQGCPVLSPNYTLIKDLPSVLTNHTYLQELSQKEPFHTMRAVVVRAESLPFSVTQSLVSGGTEKQQDLSDFIPAADCKVGEKLKFNFLEVSLPYLELVAADRTIYVLTFDGDRPNYNQLAALIIFIKSKVPSAVFVLVGISRTGSKQKIPDGFNKSLDQSLSKTDSRLQASIKEINQQLHIQQKSMSFAQQEAAVSLYQLKDALTTREALLSDIVMCDNILSSADNKGLESLGSSLEEAAERIHAGHPTYKVLPEELVMMMTSITKQPGIQKEAAVISELRDKHRQHFGPKAACYRKALELMHKIGYVLYVPGNHGDEGLVITDLTWFSDIIHKLNTVKEPAKDVSEDILMVKPETPVLDRARVREILTKAMNPDEVPHFKAMFQEMGLFQEDPNTKHLIMSTDLLAAPPVPIDHYIDKREGVNVLCRSVQVPCRVPPALYTTLLLQMAAPFPPCVLWDKGIIIQQSPAVICITLEDTDDGTMIHIQTQTASPSFLPDVEETKPIQDDWRKAGGQLLGNALMMYHAIIEYWLYKCKLYYTVQEPLKVNIDENSSEADWCAVTNNHTLRHKTTDNPLMCKTCAQTPDALRKQWAQYKLVHPGFVTPGMVKTDSTAKDQAVKGSWAVTEASGGEFSLGRPMHPCDLYEWRVTVFKDSGFSFSLRNNSKDHAVAFGEHGEDQNKVFELISILVEENKVKIQEWKRVLQAKHAKKKRTIPTETENLTEAIKGLLEDSDDDDDDDDDSDDDSDDSISSGMESDNFDFTGNNVQEQVTEQLKLLQNLQQPGLGADAGLDAANADMINNMAKGMLQGLIGPMQGLQGGDETAEIADIASQYIDTITEGMLKGGNNSGTGAKPQKRTRARSKKAGENEMPQSSAEGATEEATGQPEGQPGEEQKLVWKRCVRTLKGVHITAGDTVCFKMRFLENDQDESEYPTLEAIKEAHKMEGVQDEKPTTASKAPAVGDMETYFNNELAAKAQRKLPTQKLDYLTESAKELESEAKLFKEKAKEIKNLEDPMVEFSIELLGGDVLCTAKSPLSDNWQPVVKTNSMTSMVVNNRCAQHYSSGSMNWEVGMRLEAKDKKTPTLICVATVIQKDEKNGKVLIHFDGWTSTYDYWAKTTDVDLHPIGFMEHVIKTNQHTVVKNMKKELQKPKNYQKRFEWNSYLKEVCNYPVPYHLFTQLQTFDSPKFELSPDTSQYLRNHCVYTSTKSITCKGIEHRPICINNTLLLEFEKSTNQSAQMLKEFPYTILPRGMDRQFLLYPALKDLWMSKDDVAFLLCCHYGGQIHLIDSEGCSFLDEHFATVEQATMHYMMKVATMIHLFKFMMKNEDFIQDQLKFLVRGVDTLEHTRVQDRLRKFFRMFSCLIVYPTTLDSFKHGISKLVTNQVAKEFPMEMRKYIKKHPGFDGVLALEGAPVCDAHKACDMTGSGLNEIPREKLQNHYHLISELALSDNKLKDIPIDFFQSFKNLEELNLAENALFELPHGLSNCPKLKALILKSNRLKLLPKDFSALKEKLVVLDISGNQFVNIPEVVFQCTQLEELQANHIILRELQPQISKLKSLKILGLGGNIMKKLPAEITELENLQELDVSGVRWIETNERGARLSQEGLNNFVDKYPILFEHIFKLSALFHEHDTSKQGALDGADLQSFNQGLFAMFARLQDDQDNNEEYCYCPPEMFGLKNLKILNLSFQRLTKVTAHFKEFEKLEELWLSNNPNLQSISGEVSTIKTLKVMPLRGCPNLKTPPKEVVSRGFKAVHGYLKRLNMGSVECKRTKLMMVGLGGAGKTSLVRALKKTKSTERKIVPNQLGSYRSPHDYDSYLRTRYGSTYATEGITDGIDITNWTVSDVTFGMWDFAGQTVYYNTHQFFMSNRAVYLLLWNIRLGYEHAGLDFWLSSIACHAPKAPILVIGTHCDQVEKFWLPNEELEARYPQIKGFYAISCTSNKGIEELASEIVSVALKEKYMGERIPEAWLNLETRMLSEKSKTDSLEWEYIETCAEECGIVEKPEILEAVRFLHELGAVQHFQNMFLKTRVVINPQWIVDAMACVVSVHDTPIEDGKLKHSDIDKVWKKFSKELHSWLLRLTEEFDLTFPLKDQEANVVPCLLPAEEPKFLWSDVSTVVGAKETKMLYKFDYLPAGLFNRAQVRLYQFSDSSTIWKKGSLLKKNGHLALLKQRVNNVHIKVQGPRPENIVFMVHEVFEGLMSESFHGVTYDYFVPCSDCVKAFSQDPSLFPASKIRRATELKAPFLQCDKLFHTLSLHELHAVMPPDNSSDFDIHLERSLRDLDDLKDDLSYDVFMIYNNKDIPEIGHEDRKIHPRKIMLDLEDNGYRVWFSPDPSQIDIQKETITIRQTKLVIMCMSNHFVADPDSCRLFYYIKQNLQKNIQLVVLGETMKWKETDIGMHCAADVFVNMTDPKRYQHKIKELLGQVKDVVLNRRGPQEAVSQHPECFISYCWNNSADAVKKGTRSTPEAVGYGDPRAFKDHLENNGIRCWIDVDNVGKGTLFEDIAQGLRHAKVMLVCVSDEIGMLSLGFPKVNLQFEVPSAMERLLEAVRSQIPVDGDEEADGRRMDTSSTPSYTPSNNNHLAFQELLELAQRKFLRQVNLYAESMESSPYPRLMVMDYLRPEEVEKYKAEEKRKRKEEEEEERAKKAAEDGEDGEKCEAREGCTETEREVNPEVSRECEEQKCDEEAPPAGRSSRLEAVQEDGEKMKAEQDDVVRSRWEEENKRMLEEEDMCALPLVPRRPGSSSGNRPSSAKKPIKLLKRRTTSSVMAMHADLIEELHEMDGVPEFCIRFLCEHEEGWHEASQYLILPPVETSQFDDFLDDVAPYMARLYAIMKHTALSLPVLDLDKGAALRKRLIDKCGLDSEFKNEYLNWRKIVMETDADKGLGDLARCHLPSGKVLWLCPGHRQQERVTVLSSDVADLGINEVGFDVDYAAPSITSAAQEGSNPTTTTAAAAATSGESNTETASKPQTPQTRPSSSNKPRPPSSDKPRTPSGAKPVPARRVSKLSKRESTTSPQAQKAAANIMTQGNKREGSQACVVM